MVRARKSVEKNARLRWKYWAGRVLGGEESWLVRNWRFLQDPLLGLIKTNEEKTKTETWNQQSGLWRDPAGQRPGPRRFHSLGKLPAGTERRRDVGKGLFKLINRWASASIYEGACISPWHCGVDGCLILKELQQRIKILKSSWLYIQLHCYASHTAFALAPLPGLSLPPLSCSVPQDWPL